jgi:hypothetical protein
LGGARFSRHKDVPSKNPRLGREAQEAFAPEGKMALVTYAETKVTRARGGTRVENDVAAGDTNKYPARGAGTA